MRIKALFLLILFCLLIIDYGFCLDWKNLHEKADKISLADALNSVKSEPGSSDSLYILGLVYLNLHKDKEAQDTFSKILNLDPDATEAKWGLAESLRRQHRIKESEKILNEVIDKNPGFSPAYISLAYIKYIQMDFERCVRLALKVMRQGSKNVDLSNYVRSYTLYAGAKGMIAHYGGPISKAVNGTAVLPNLRKAEKLQPDSPAVVFGLGSFYLLAPALAGGNLEKAEEYLKKTIEIDPLLSDGYVRLGQLYKMRNDNDKYQEYLRKALEIDPKNEIALDIANGECKFICVKSD